MPRSAAGRSIMNDPAVPPNSCPAVSVPLLIKKICGVVFFFLLRKLQDGHEPEPAVEVVNHHINIDMNQLMASMSFSGVGIDLGVRIVPNANVGGNNTAAPRVASHAAVDIDDQEAGSGNDARARRVPVDAAEEGQDDSIRGAVCSSIEDMLVDALWDRCCRIFSMDPEQLRRALVVAALATMYMSVLSVFITPPAGPIFEVHIRAYYMSLGGTSVLSAVEAATAAWVVNSDVTHPGRLFFARCLLFMGLLVLSFLTTHMFML